MTHTKQTKQSHTVTKTDCRKATTAHILYLLNLSLLPALGFFFLWITTIRFNNKTPAFVKHHYQQALIASIFAGVLLVIISTLFVLLGNISSPYTWMFLIIYFTCVHSALLVLGVIALTRAHNARTFTYPLIGQLERQ